MRADPWSRARLRRLETARAVAVEGACGGIDAAQLTRGAAAGSAPSLRCGNALPISGQSP
jgi:hypothetical protein